jgi:hypothetical protein
MSIFISLTAFLVKIYWIVVQLKTIVHIGSCVKSSLDDPTFADKVHFNHPTTGGHQE